MARQLMPFRWARLAEGLLQRWSIAGNSFHRSLPSVRMSGGMGGGAGKGGGGGGSIRDAGGAFGQMEYVREEQYFRALQAEQIRRLKEHLDDEISYHEAQIKRHQEAISRHKKRKSRFPRVGEDE